MDSPLERSELDLLVFISSRMDAELGSARDAAKRAIETIDIGRSWLFECTPASSEIADNAYLRKVREADFVVWLVGSTTTPPVENEVNECLASHGRLLVFKLPAQQRDARTDGLLENVGRVFKWREVATLAELGSEIKVALFDELVRGVRDPSGPVRVRTLQNNRDWSVAQCEASWKAVGVSAVLAEELARDTTVGDVLGYLPPGLNVVTGPQGSGKTLASRRLFQRAVQAALDDPSEPFPILIDAADSCGNLREIIAQRCRGCVDPNIHPILVIVDGLDERGAGEATALLRELETYVIANPGTTVVANVRPLPGIRHNGNVVEKPSLGFDEVEALVERVSGKERREIVSFLLQGSLYDSVKFPLFAVMLGTWLRDNEEPGHVSTRRLVEYMAETALHESTNDSETTDRLLQRLAVRAITDGSRVRPLEVTPRRVEQRQLTDSRLVYETESGLDFALPIFREWYAARAILEGTEAIDDMDLTSERWAIPLSIVAYSEDETSARVVMGRVATTNPGIASAVLEDDENVWYSGGSRPTMPGTAMEVGAELRQAMAMWGRGLGPIFRTIGPTNADGDLALVGVIFDGERLAVGWYSGSESLDPVVEFTREHNPIGRDADWQLKRDWPSWTSGAVPSIKLWSWVMTRRYLARNLTEALEQRRLSHLVADSLSELAWEFGSGVGRGTVRQGVELSIPAVLEYIGGLPEDSRTAVVGRNKVFSWDEIAAVRERLSVLSRGGHEQLRDPWPAADLPRSPSPGWPPYIDDQLLARTSAVYAAALGIYQEMVERWFQPFSGRLRLYRLLPVRLEGSLTKHEIDGGIWPGLSWRPIILPGGQESHVDFELGESDDERPDVGRYFEEQREAFGRLRGGHPDNVGLFCVGPSALDVLSDCPATELAHEWLVDELKDLGWVD